jgi:putative transposase
LPPIRDGCCPEVYEIMRVRLATRHPQDAPDQFWVTDCTYIRTDEGFLHLAVVIDLFSWRVIGWSMQGRTAAPRSARTLEMACCHRSPSNSVRN